MSLHINGTAAGFSAQAMPGPIGLRAWIAGGSVSDGAKARKPCR